MWRKVKSQYDSSDYGNSELICKYIIPFKDKKITLVPMEKNENITLNSSSNILHIGRQIINGTITINESNNVTVIDAKTYDVVKNVPTGKGPHGFRISQDSKIAYIANMGEDTISVIDITTLKDTKQITVGKTPVTTGITKDGKTKANCGYVVAENDAPLNFMKTISAHSGISRFAIL